MSISGFNPANFIIEDDIEDCKKVTFNPSHNGWCRKVRNRVQESIISFCPFQFYIRYTNTSSDFNEMNYFAYGSSHSFLSECFASHNENEDMAQREFIKSVEDHENKTSIIEDSIII